MNSNLNEHWRGVVTIAAIIVFIACRAAGPPASYFGFAILFGWLCFLAWNQLDKIASGFQAIRARLFVRTEVDIERDIALADVAMDSAVGDQQNAKRLADWAMAVQRLESDLESRTLPVHQRLSKERTLRVYRRSIADVTKAEAKRHAKATGAPLPFSFAVPAIGGLLPMLAVGVAVAAPGIWEKVRADGQQHRAEQAETTAEHNASVASVLAARLNAANSKLAEAQAQQTQTAATIAHERLLAAHYAAVERERNRAIQSVNAGGPPPAWSLRDDAGAAASNSPGGASDHTDASPHNPG